MDEQATTFKDKNENNSCYHYLRINDKKIINCTFIIETNPKQYTEKLFSTMRNLSQGK